MAEKEEYRNEVTLLTRGLFPGGSVSGQAHNKWGTCSITYYDKRLRPYFGDLLEGGYVIDKWHADYPTGYDLVMNGPMVDTSLPDDAPEDECPQPSEVLLFGLQGEFKTLAMQKAVKPTWRGLNKVNVRTYLAMWREVEGVRIGKRVGDTVEWEDGVVEPIPEFEKRNQWSMDDNCRPSEERPYDWATGEWLPRLSAQGCEDSGASGQAGQAPGQG